MSVLDKDQPPLVIGPPAGSRLVGYGLLAVVGCGALVYSIGAACMDWPDDMRWWELAFIMGVPLLFAAVLASMAWENGQPFILDRGRGALFDRGRPVLSLDAVRAVAATLDLPESNYIYIELVLDNGRTFCLRRYWWALNGDENAALARAAPIADYLGVELQFPLGTVVREGRT